MSVPLKTLPADQRPRERLIRLGAEALADFELVAILLQTGTRDESVIELAKRLLHHCRTAHPDKGLLGLLDLRDAELTGLIPGIGPAKLCQVLAALQLGLRAQAPRLKRVDVGNPKAVFDHVYPLVGNLQYEKFMVIILNAKNQVLDVESVSVGTLNATLVHPREIFKSAIRRSAHAIILIHNHPSGDPSPSREDREITQRLTQAGKLLGIEVLDHLIIGDGRYTSFREKGLV